MKTLVVHNHYQQPGGEDVVVRSEKELLKAAGHQVVEYIRHNDEIASYGLWRKATLTARTVWAWDSYREIKALIQRERPDLAHLHNTFPLISPAAYYACREAGVPVVQSLHNYRLLCPAVNFFRRGRVCEECLRHTLWRGVLHGCYRGSRAAASTLTLMLAVHRWLRTWTCGVDCFIALYEVSRQKFIQGGIPSEKIVVKPNFILTDPGCRPQCGEYALYVGRLSPARRVLKLLAAWQRLRARIPLRIAGSGPDREFLELQAKQMGISDIRFLGQLPHDDVMAVMKGARCLVITSECYEAFGLVLIEAFACGVPVICSRLEAIEEIVADGRTGLHYTPGDVDDLAQKVEWAWSHPEKMAAMGRAARAEYEAKYTAERNYKMLMQIYRRAVGAGRTRIPCRDAIVRVFPAPQSRQQEWSEHRSGQKDGCLEPREPGMQRWSVSTTCPFCKGASSPYWEKVNVRKCAACGLRFRYPPPTAGQLTQLYVTSWSNPETHRRETGGTDPELATIYATKLASSLGRRDFSGLRLLDFGAGRGAMVAALQKLSGEVYAVDWFGSQYLERHGFRAWPSVDEMSPGLAFDGIVAIDVVDRLPTPPTELTKLKNLLVPGGWIYVSAPNAHGLNARLCASDWREAVDPGQLFFFTPSSMQRMLAQCGFRRPRRLRWLIPYSKNSAYRCFQYFLQLLWIDGELRYIAFRD